MKADDPRHGTRRGYYAHRAAGQEACDPCKRGAAQAEMRYQHDRIMGRARRVDPRGTQRRLHALSALGWTWKDIADEIGTSRSNIEKWANNDPRQFVYASTAARVSEVYDRLCMSLRGDWVGERTRKAAVRKGYAPPLAWDDIDNDPLPATDDKISDFDEVVVERILAGDWSLRANAAERREIVARWSGSDAQLERYTNWNVARIRRGMAGFAA